MNQLVLQFSPFGLVLKDFDKLVRLEDELIDALEGHAKVDGHDMGSNEGNLFIFTTDPSETFSRCLPIVECAGLMKLLGAGYRDVDGEIYTRVWPKQDAAAFTVK